MITRSRWLPWSAYLVLAIAVLGLTLLPGYILTFDMVFTPRLHPALELTSLLPYKLLTSIVNVILPGEIIEKLLLLGIFLLAGLGMHKLVPAKSHWARYAAGIMYAINPFTYGRLMAGQYLVLAGYALMPWFVAALVGFIRRPEWGTARRLSAWALAIGFLSLHFFGFTALTAVLALGIMAWHVRHRPWRLRRLATWSGGVALALLVANSFWLLPLALGHSGQTSLISGFDQRFFLSFRTIGDGTFGQLFNTLSLYGFWADAQNLYKLPKTIFGWWWVIALVILAIASIGAIKNWRRDHFGIKLMLALLTVAFVLAQGIMGSPFASFNLWLMNHLPFYRGYREPGKFIGLIALSLGYLFGLGADLLIEWAERQKAEWLPGLLVALPLLYTPTMLWGSAGQLHTVNYPADWYAFNHRLSSEHTGGKVLFLPWHQYIRFGFAGRIIANPAPHFFNRPTVAGDNAEIGLIERQSSNPQSQFIQSQILAPSRAGAVAKLKARGFEYVVLAKEADYKSYSWLNTLQGLREIQDTSTLKVYRLE